MNRPPWMFVGALVTLGLVVAALAVSLGDDVETSPAEWMSAVATLLALLAAFAASWYVSKAYDLELKREQDRDNDARQVQASQVTAWVHNPGRLWFSNPSGLPIWDVTFLFHFPDGQKIECETLPILPPYAEPQDILIEIDTPAVTALAGWFGRSTAATIGWPMVEIRFRDAAGVRWTRHADGVLKHAD